MKKILLFLLTFLACTYSAQAVDMKLACDDSGWGSTSWVFTDNGDGTWTYVIEDASTLAGDQFKIVDSDGKWYGCGGDITFGIGTTNGLYSNNDSNVKFAKALSGKVVLTVSNYSVNTWGNSINLYVTDGTSSYTDLYIVYKNGDSWDALDENLKFTTENGTDYVLNDVAITAGATFAIGNSELHFGIDGVTMTPAATLAEASNRTGWSNNSNYGKWASTIERNVNIVATLGSVQSWGRQIDFKVYYVEGTTPTYPTSLYLYPDGKEIPAVEGKEGVYSVAGLTKSEIASFRFNTKSDNSGTAYGTTTGADVAITLGDNIDMKEGGGNRWTLTPEFDGTYDIEIDLSTMKFFVTQSTVTYPDVMYYYNGAKPCTVTLANIGDGVYSADIEVAAGESFRFYTDANATDDNTSYGPETAEEAVSLGSDITISHTSTNRWTIAEAGTYTFTVSLKHHRLNVVKKSVTPTYTEFWLVGEETKDGETAWSFIDAFKFKTTDGVTYTLKNVSVTAGKQFKISDGTHYMGYGDNDGQMTIADQATGYDIYDGAKNLAWHTTITVNITYTKTSATQGNIKVEYILPDLYVRGIGGNWSANSDNKMTCNADGIYTLNNVALKNAEFKIGSGEGSNWTYGFGAASDATAVMPVTADGTVYTIHDVKDGKNLKIGEVSENVDIAFKPDFNAHTGILIITLLGTSGVNDVEIFDEAPVEFYNLQGVRVDGELTPGLYIRRQGNSASKVLIR